MTAAERLARALLLFHRGSPWTADNGAEWHALTGSYDATTKVLCDLAREILADEQAKR
jgi:hypothetical protein